MKASTVVLIGSILLDGCALTRVSQTSHEMEVSNLKLVGLTYTEAISKGNAAGFSCSSHQQSQPYKSSKAGGQMVKQGSCWKTSAEFFCPQQRYVHFEYSAVDEKVLTMWSSITEKSCF